MKIKKFLEKAAEEDRESLINDKDIEFLASIGVDYNKKREAAKKEPDSSYYRTAKAVNYKALFTSIACFLIVAITVVSLSLYFSLKSSPIDEPIHYFEDDVADAIDSSLLELNRDLQLFTLTIDEEEYDVDIKRYDAFSGETLFYSLDFTGKGKNFKLEIVVNKFYEYKKMQYAGDELKEAQFSSYTTSYTMKYYEISEPMPVPMLVEVECKGEMQIGEQWIYVVNYKETAFGQCTFVETLQSLISFK